MVLIIKWLYLPLNECFFFKLISSNLKGQQHQKMNSLKEYFLANQKYILLVFYNKIS
jgi:hypothetical protein